jgi:hypothetical protein
VEPNDGSSQPEPWILRASARDATAITRWCKVTTQVEFGGQRTPLLHRVLGWDDSSLPSWVQLPSSGHDRVVTETTELGRAPLLDVLRAHAPRQRAGLNAEVRRIEAPVSDWYGLASAEVWNLHVPLAVYELWDSREAHDQGRSRWAQLTEKERIASGINGAQLGYLGSTIVLVPQRSPYFVGVHHLVLPNGPQAWGELRIVSEVRDGAVVIARTAERLRIEPWCVFRRIRSPIPAAPDHRSGAFDHPARNSRAWRGELKLWWARKETGDLSEAGRPRA